jgi:hypothetical protein
MKRLLVPNRRGDSFDCPHDAGPRTINLYLDSNVQRHRRRLRF